MPLTKSDIKQVLVEAGVVTKKDLKKIGVVTKRDLNKAKKELIMAIGKVALTSPTINQFNKLEERVGNLGASN